MRSVKYIVQGVKTLAKRKIEVPVLDATAISVSLIRGDYKTAGAVMFLLSMGEIIRGMERIKISRRSGTKSVSQY